MKIPESGKRIHQHHLKASIGEVDHDGESRAAQSSVAPIVQARSSQGSDMTLTRPNPVAACFAAEKAAGADALARFNQCFAAVPRASSAPLEGLRQCASATQSFRPGMQAGRVKKET
jgi:hypothetical protein